MSNFIPTSAYEPGFPIEWEGLDYESAKDATPRWYGVSTGNGNDGVSHTWPSYYVRTCEPYRLAQAAIVAEMNPDYYKWALENSDIDGEADYEISATIYDPPGNGNDHDPEECEDEDCPECKAINDGEYSSWCDVNGAWLIVEVFPIEEIDDERSQAMRYDSLKDALSADVLALVTE